MTDSRPPILHPKSVNILRWLGYGLIAFAFADVLALLYPPNFTDPQWEFQLIGNLVERAPVPLLGFGLVFLNSQANQRWSIPERILVKGLSFLCIGLAVIFLLLVPLGIFDTIRINADNGERIDTRLEEVNAQIDSRLEGLERANPTDIQGNIANLQAAISAAQAEDQQQQLNAQLTDFLELTQDLPFATDPVAAKAALLERANEQALSEKAQLKRQAEAEKGRLRRGVLENSLKWNFDALLAGLLFGMMYFQTAWLRKMPLSDKKKKRASNPEPAKR